MDTRPLKSLRDDYFRSVHHGLVCSLEGVVTLSVQPKSRNRQAIVANDGFPVACALTPKWGLAISMLPALLSATSKMIANDPEQDGAKEALEILTQIRRTR